MAFSHVGAHQIVLQTYKHKKHRIICEMKVLPCPATHFGKKSLDYHWMTPGRWTNIESGLWGLLEKEQDIHNVHADLSIDHIKVRVDSSENPHPSAQILLPGVTLTKRDLCLNIHLEYIPQEDANNLGKNIESSNQCESDNEVQAKEAPKDKPTKRTPSTLAINLQVEPAKETHKDKSIPPDRKVSVDTKQVKLPHNGRSSREKEPTKRVKRSHSIDQPAVAAQVSPGKKVPVKIKNARRSISQDSAQAKPSSSGRSALEKKPTKRTHTPESENSKTSADGQSPTGRPRRALTRPSHLENFIVGQKKRTGKDSADEPIGKKANTNAIANGNGDASPPSATNHSEMANALAALAGLGPPPSKVEILLMNKMEKEEVLETFSKYKSDLNQFFTEHRHKRTDNFLGIQHVHVIDILRRDIEKTMLRKLSKVYGTSSSYASLQINALLPLWIVRLFMDTFNFATAEEAVRQIRAQLAYSTYQNALNDEPLESDLEN